jgi:hypothetical protein
MYDANAPHGLGGGNTAGCVLCSRGGMGDNFVEPSLVGHKSREHGQRIETLGLDTDGEIEMLRYFCL